jgi:hypothetical protein
MDLDLTEIELGSDIGNLHLLRRQLNSVQSIRYEQQRKDELIFKLKERIRHLEGEAHSYEDIKEHVLMQSRHVMKMKDKEIQGRFAIVGEQVQNLKDQVQNSEEEHNATRKRYSTLNVDIILQC